MNYRELVDRLLSHRLINHVLVELSSPAATEFEIEAAEHQLGSSLDPGLVEFYSYWNGAGLDVINISSTKQLKNCSSGIVFASDPSGFVYYFAPTGHVVEEDSDSGESRIVALDFRDFLLGLVFGARAEEFMGVEWLNELRRAEIA